MSYIISQLDGRDLVQLRTVEDVKRYFSPKRPSAVKVLATKVHDGNGNTFRIREV